MAKIILYGASDDLIEIDGDLEEEFNYYRDSSGYLAISDGTLLRVTRDEDGIWRFSPIRLGSARIDIQPGLDDDRHSDIVTLEGDNLRWVALAIEVRKF